MEKRMNARFYRCRPRPLAPSAVVVLSWSETSRAQEVLLEWYLVLDAEQDQPLGQRFRVVVDPAAEHGPRSIDEWLMHAQQFAVAAVQAGVDQLWGTRKLPGLPPLIEFEDVDEAALYGVRIRGGGSAGLNAMAELVSDPETRDFVASLLQVKPLTVEVIPS